MCRICDFDKIDLEEMSFSSRSSCLLLDLGLLCAAFSIFFVRGRDLLGFGGLIEGEIHPPRDLVHVWLI